MTLKRTSVLTVILVSLAFTSVHTSASSPQRRHHYDALVRICTNTSDDKMLVGCLGVYVNNYWVLADLQCLRMNITHLLMGSQNMDCTSGQRRSIKDYTLVGSAMLIQLRSDFTPGQNVSMMSLPKCYIPNAQCLVFCSPRSIIVRNGSAFIRGTCDEKIASRKLKLGSCHGQLRSKPKHVRCGTMEHGESHKMFNPLWSPVVCADRLLGFVDIYNVHNNKVKFTHLLPETRRIKDMIVSRSK